MVQREVGSKEGGGELVTLTLMSGLGQFETGFRLLSLSCARLSSFSSIRQGEGRQIREFRFQYDSAVFFWNLAPLPRDGA